MRDISSLFAGFFQVWIRIVEEFYEFLAKILSSSVKTKRIKSRKRFSGHQIIAFFTEPHSFGLCKAWVEGVTDTMTFGGTLSGCVPAI